MEYLENDILYNKLEKTEYDFAEVKDLIQFLLDNDPTTLHKTLNYLEMQADSYKQEKMRIQELQKQKNLKVDLIKKIIIETMSSMF